jgi:hypothetical protein
MAYPGMVMAYLRRFDESRSSCVYSFIFLSSFSFFSFLYICVSYFAPFIPPFSLINTPLSIITVMAYANRRDELQNIMDGKIFDAKHKNKAETLMDVQRSLDRSQEK